MKHLIKKGNQLLAMLILILGVILTDGVRKIKLYTNAIKTIGATLKQIFRIS